MKLKGIGASDGIAVAKVFELKEAQIKITEAKIKDVTGEIKKVDKAIATAIKEIEDIKKAALKNLGEDEAAVFDAHIQVASDPSLAEDIKNLIKNESRNALSAVSTVATSYAAIFDGMDDEYMKERAADVRDVSKRIVYALAGIKQASVTGINSEVIVVASDLTPSDTAQLNKKFVKGFVTDIGGRTSHAAIMARSLEIPAVLGLKDVTSKVKTGDTIAMDGNSGEVLINPTATEIAAFKKKAEEVAKERRESKTFIGKKSVTKDGFQVELAANIGSPKDVTLANDNDAEAVGLFRSEFLYMDAKNWPTEEEQYQSYKAALEGMKNKLVIVRTLDIGGDKTLEYFEFPHEMNPFLGYRAIRLTLDKKDVFRTQLRALLRASVHGKLGIMFPMIATVEELLAAKAELEKARKELTKEKIKFDKKIQVGMMVEIPAAAVLTNQFADHVDFLSIGTNDLMQYTFAADRMNERVAYLYQPLNPSILAMINMTIQGGAAKGKWVGMCGEMAGDKNAIPLLVGMGLHEFSMSASSILPARKQISKINKKAAEKLLAQALKCSTEKEVQALVDKFNAAK